MAIRIRPIEPADGPKLVDLHESLSDVTRHYRFFSPHPHLTPAEVDRFSHVDHVDREALVAVDGDDNVVGVGRFDRTGDDIGEVAFVVTDRLQGQGIGSRLLEALGEWGRAHGVARFEADVLADNRSMMHVFRKWAPGTSVTFCDGVLHFDMPIPTRVGQN
ncbi:MAG TPA: GNAT family N-acetyltransferase [Acidimicrobiales bacterium]|nr:GNAT family N-acetyltransferase [Acidimicrobiales bacterium]